MAGRTNSRDKNVVCVVSDLTTKQASRLTSEIMRAKHNIAPQSRGTAAITTREGIGALLQKGIRMIGSK